jgi:hypothetical protein
MVAEGQRGRRRAYSGCSRRPLSRRCSCASRPPGCRSRGSGPPESGQSGALAAFQRLVARRTPRRPPSGARPASRRTHGRTAARRGYQIELRIRERAPAGYGEMFVPMLRREPLYQAENHSLIPRPVKRRPRQTQPHFRRGHRRQVEPPAGRSAQLARVLFRKDLLSGRARSAQPPRPPYAGTGSSSGSRGGPGTSSGSGSSSGGPSGSSGGRSGGGSGTSALGSFAANESIPTGCPARDLRAACRILRASTRRPTLGAPARPDGRRPGRRRPSSAKRPGPCRPALSGRPR